MKVNKDDTILKLKDGGLLKILETMSQSGDAWLDEYVICRNDIDLIFTKYWIRVRTKNYDDYSLNISSMIELFGYNYDRIPNMTELEFIKFFSDFIKSKDSKAEIEIFNSEVKDSVSVQLSLVGE